MTQLPYKYNTLQDQQTVEVLTSTDELKRLYFKFSHLDPTLVVGIIPKYHMITKVIIAVQEAFLPGTTDFSLHFRGSENGSIASGSLSTSRTFIPFTGDNTSNQDMLSIVNTDKFLVFSAANDVQNLTFTRGSGWGLIEYLNMNSVPGYRRL